LLGIIFVFGALLPGFDLSSTIKVLKVIMGSWRTMNALKKVIQILLCQRIKVLLPLIYPRSPFGSKNGLEKLLV